MEIMKARYTYAGRTERIAGYTGKVYTAEVFENGKLVGKLETVMCDHGGMPAQQMQVSGT